MRRADFEQAGYVFGWHGAADRLRLGIEGDQDLVKGQLPGSLVGRTSRRRQKAPRRSSLPSCPFGLGRRHAALFPRGGRCPASRRGSTNSTATASVLSRNCASGQYVFKILSEVRTITEEWMDQYNVERSHDALGDLTPFEYRWAHQPRENSNLDCP